MQVNNRRKRSALGVSRSGETSRLGLRDPVPNGIKCGAHGGKKKQDEVVNMELVQGSN
jgi:hypothetical protein